MLKGLLFSETQQLMERLGEKPGRAEVLAGWLYHDRCLGQGSAERDSLVNILRIILRTATCVLLLWNNRRLALLKKLLSMPCFFFSPGVVWPDYQLQKSTLDVRELGRHCH